MIRINLLPHREEARRHRRQQFYALAVVMVIAAAIIALAVHTWYASRIEAQQSDNDFLRSEMVRLDKDIAEIKRLKEQTQALLSRKQVIELLQSHRAETVHVMNELARQTPEGIMLGGVQQKGLVITLFGLSQSNARVSTLMRNLDASPIFEKPDLVVIRVPESKDLDQAKKIPSGRQIYYFELKVSIERAPTEEEKLAAEGKPAGQSAPVAGVQK